MTTHTAALLRAGRPAHADVLRAIRDHVGPKAMPEVEATIAACHAALRYVREPEWAFCLLLRLDSGQPLPVALDALRTQAGVREES